MPVLPPVDPAPTDPPTRERPARPPRSYGLLEALVAMSIVLTLAGMLVPYSVRVGERTALEKAHKDIATIASSFAYATSARASWMRGQGTLPADAPAELTPQVAPVGRLDIPGALDRAQRDALLLALQADPWGCSYLIFLDHPGVDRDVSRVVSAGPDRSLGTADDLQQPIR
jgi:hypothetical protein